MGGSCLLVKIVENKDFRYFKLKALFLYHGSFEKSEKEPL